jgi:DNA-binding transcriptional ArsR family regulator
MATKREKDARRETLRPHPARDKILDVMRSYGAPISPTQLARITGYSLGSTAYHVRTLVSAGVVELAEEGRVRGAVEHFYSLIPDAAETMPSVDPVLLVLNACQALTVPDPDGGYPRPSVVDDQVRERILALLDRIRPEVQDLVAQSTEAGKR